MVMVNDIYMAVKSHRGGPNRKGPWRKCEPPPLLLVLQDGCWPSLQYYHGRLNSHTCLHIGQSFFSFGTEAACCFSIHFSMQCMWNAWLQAPHTGGHSSPGIWHSGQHASKAILQIPHTSSFTFHFQAATMCHFLISTFILQTC